MPDKPRKSAEEPLSESETAERFKAVVKRLLDTPPKHKTGKGETERPRRVPKKESE